MTGGMPESASGQFWFLVQAFWHDYWLFISLGIVALVAYEIFTRHGSSHHNSRNGFSPSFNRLAGSGTYILLQGLLYLIFRWIFGDIVYCYLWPLPIHIAIFTSTGWLLRKIRFWVY